MVNLKKAALAVLALGVAGVANAAMYAPPPVETQEPVAKHGFYAGIGLGGVGFHNKTEAQGSAALDGIAEVSANGSSNGGNVGLNSWLLGGYSWVFPNKVFLGAEVFGTLANTSASAGGNVGGASDVIFGTSATGSADLHLIMDGSYGVRALPGYQLAPNAVVYGIAGWASLITDAELSSSGAVASSDFGISESSSASSKQHENFYGYQLGLGSMINVTDNIAIRGDLIWSAYGKKTIASGGTTTDIGSAQGSITADPTTIEANVGLVYMFD